LTNEDFTVFIHEPYLKITTAQNLTIREKETNKHRYNGWKERKKRRKEGYTAFK
jgi:hypothetical protein